MQIAALFWLNVLYWCFSCRWFMLRNRSTGAFLFMLLNVSCLVCSKEHLNFVVLLLLILFCEYIFFYSWKKKEKKEEKKHVRVFHSHRIWFDISCLTIMAGRASFKFSDYLMLGLEVFFDIKCIWDRKIWESLLVVKKQWRRNEKQKENCR